MGRDNYCVFLYVTHLSQSRWHPRLQQFAALERLFAYNKREKGRRQRHWPKLLLSLWSPCMSHAEQQEQNHQINQLLTGEYRHWWRKCSWSQVRETEKWLGARNRTKGEAEWWQNKRKNKPVSLFTIGVTYSTSDLLILLLFTSGFLDKHYFQIPGALPAVIHFSIYLGTGTRLQPRTPCSKNWPVFYLL